MDLQRTISPEDVVDLINFDCNNEENPSNISCTHPWFYWYKEKGSQQDGDWKEDTSARFVCTGIRTLNCQHPITIEIFTA